MLSLPPGAGTLLIAGGLENSLNNNPIIHRFIENCGGRDANVLVIAAGYPSQPDAEQAAVDYANALGVASQTMVVPPTVSQPVEVSPEYSCVLFTSADAAHINPEIFSSLREVWLGGVPLLADGGAASLIGQMVIGDMTVIDVENDTLSEQTYQTDDGLKLVDINITPHILSQNQWDEWLALATDLPSVISIGLPENTAIEITRNRASTMGDASIFLLDLRHAALDYNDNHSAVIANGFLDVFAPYEKIEPALADQRIEPVTISTPIIYTPTFTPSPTEPFTPNPSFTPTQRATITPTATPRIKPSSTPLIIPPPSDPGTRNLMVMFVAVIVLVIVAGIVLNRRRIQ